MTEEERKKFQYTDDILKLVDNQLQNDTDTLTRSDLQGVVTAVVNKIYNHK